MVLSTLLSTRSGFRRASLLLAAGLMTGCSVFGGASVEEAPYQLVQKDEQFEVRDYVSLIVAQTQVSESISDAKAGNKAFGRLFKYISGENEASDKMPMTASVITQTSDSASSEKIAMTAPVTFQKEGGSWRYRFVLPESYTIDSAPRPLNPDVSLEHIDAKRVASVTYSGLGRDKARVRNTQALINWIEEQGLEALSEPRWAGYNPPWTLPQFRRNEVLIDVAVK